MNGKILEFGPFRLDPALKELRRRGARVPVPASQIRLLLLFVNHRSDLITREQIAACLWKDSSTVDEVSGINTAVNRLRSHLGDDPAAPKYIETVVGEGYRFVAAVSEDERQEVTVMAEPRLGRPAPQTDFSRLENGAAVTPAILAESSGGSDDRSSNLSQIPTPTSVVLSKAQQRRSYRRHWKWMATGMLVFAALVTYFLSRWQRNAHPAATPELELTQVTRTGDVQFADISSDGKFIAFVRESGGQKAIWLKQLATGRLLELAELGSDDCPGVAFSPDAAFVLFARKKPDEASGDLFSVPFLGGSAVKLLAGISGAPAISPDGRTVAFVRSTLATHGEDSVVTAAMDGSGERVLATYKAPGIHFNRVTWTADGKSLVYPLQSRLAMIATADGSAQSLPMEEWRTVDDLWNLPPGRQLIIAGELPGTSISHAQIFTAPMDGGKIQPVSHDLSTYTEVRTTADGSTLLAVQDKILSTIQVLLPGDKSEPRILSSENENRDGVFGLAWMPDGRILYASESGHSRDLIEINPDGSNARRIATSDALEIVSHPAISPRGDFMVEVRWFGKDQANLWRIDLSDGKETRLTHGLQDFPPSITPDGNWVIYSSTQGDKSVLMKVPSQGGTATQLTDFNAENPSVSGDGKWIACSYTPGPGQAALLAIVPISGGKPVRVFPLTGTPISPPLVWTPDSRAISFINEINGVGNIWQQPIAGGPSTPMTHFTDGRIFNFQWSPDGRLLLSRGTEIRDAVLFHNFRESSR